MMERLDYDALAQDINVENITCCERNANILRMLRGDDAERSKWDKTLYLLNEYIDGDPDEFFVGEGDHLGWLGYFISRSEVLQDLVIRYLPEEGDRINRFLEGMSQNRSIKSLRVSNDNGFDGWSRLGNFLENNHNLASFIVEDFLIGYEGAENLASALDRMNRHSLKDLRICRAGISDEGMAEITTALRLHSQLKILQLCNNNIGRDGCIALGNTLSRWPASNNLETLDIGNNVIDDRGIQALASGLMNCRSLKELYLGGNQSITGTGLRSISPLLQSESHSLEKLLLYDINFGDDGAIALVEGLRGDKSLKQLYFDVDVADITSVGWSAFSRLLCDTSTINNTYLSNYTLEKICGYGDDYEGIPEDIQRLLTTNRYLNRVGAAVFKILRSHRDLDMEPFFKLKMQFLPAVMSWFDRVEHIRYGNSIFEMESQRSCQSRKLSALYKFVRAMPDLTTIGYWEGRVIEIEANKCRIADERRRLHDEMRRLDDEELRLEYEEKVTLERLGDQLMDELNRNNKRMRRK